MDNDLSRSVRILEDALSTPSRGLFKSQPHKETLEADFSFTLGPHELKRLQRSEFFHDSTLRELMDQDNTIAGDLIRNRGGTWRSAVDCLYMEFFEVLQCQAGSQDSLEIVSELARCCSDTLQVIRALKTKTTQEFIQEEHWLEKERDTWRLLFILFQDRLISSLVDMEADQTPQYFGISEKECTESLFKRESLIRECQLVIDWLEAEAGDRDEPALSVCNQGWENTLHQLNSENIAFPSTRPIVTELDPDAPHRQNLQLHDLDVDDDKQLAKKIFQEVRCGKLEDAQQLAAHSGHGWRAAILEGWRLFHVTTGKENDEGIEEDMEEYEGNMNRDIWKSTAIKYVKQTFLNQYDRATIGAFCGYLEPILHICSTWEDSLWAYLKTIVDIRVESEIRDCCTKNNGYAPLPEEYWLQRMSLDEVFAKVEASSNKKIRDESKEPEHQIHKHIILDEIPRLLKDLEEWSESPNVTTHFLRFATHLVLFLDQIGQANRKESVEKVIEGYIRRLMDMQQTQLVAFYISKLNKSIQVHMYAKHLEKMLENEERAQALSYAEDCGLDVQAITKKIVENIRDKLEELDNGRLHKKMTELDKLKVSSLDWLIFYDCQRAELLRQSNAVIFQFLIMGKLDAAQIAFNKIPSDAVKEISAELGASNEEINQVIKEHLSYKLYLDAHEAFNEWFKQAKNKPVPPEKLADDAAFPEKVAHQHRESQFKAELERWKLTTDHVAKSAKTQLQNVLLFPEGWLVGAEDCDYLRKVVVPEVTFMLCSVLMESQMYGQLVQLADVVADPKRALHEEFTQDQLATLLNNIADASMYLSLQDKDGYGATHLAPYLYVPAQTNKPAPDDSFDVDEKL